MWSTCRYASLQTRETAEKLARSTGSRYVARGKKTILQLAFLARKSGSHAVNLVFQQGGCPYWVMRLDIQPSGAYRWGKKIRIDGHAGQGKD